MSDGSLTFDTQLDESGIREGLRNLKNASADTLKGAGSVFEQTGGKLTKYITKPAIAAGSAIAGLALVKGFNRLKNIDTAKAQLEGLGHSAKSVESIMDSAMQAVKGTAYGFDEAATAAASAVAAGIEPGKQLTRYLSLVGDAAAQSKLSFGEMGSIFNKIMASGKISMEEVNQLADQGIPIYKMLSEQLGVTQADVRDMVSSGKVDSETFLKAIETNIGGAAKIMGEKSFTGAIANIGASLGRIGANFLDAGGKGGGFFSTLKPLMVDLMDTMGGLEEKASAWGEKFGKAFTTVVSIIKAIPGPVLGVGTAIAVSAGPIMQLTGKLMTTAGAIKTFRTEQAGMSLVSGVLNGKLTMQQAITAKIASVTKSAASAVGSFVSRMAGKAAATARDTASTVANTVATRLNGSAASGAASKILAFAAAHKVALLASLGLAAGIAALVIYMAKTGASADDIANKITGFANNLAQMITSFANNLPQMIDSVMPAITSAIQGIISVIPTLIPVLIQAFISLFMAIVEAIPTLIEPIVTALVQGLLAIVAILPTLIPVLLQAAIKLFMAIVQAIPTIITALVNAIPQIVKAVVNMIPTLIPALLEAAITLFMAFVQAIPQIASALLKAMPKIIKAVVQGVRSGFSQVKAVGIALLKMLWNGIRSWAGALKSNVVSLARSLPGRIKSGLGSLVSIGVNWIQGLWNGIGSKAQWLYNQITSLCSNAKQKIKHFFGIKSPSRVMRYEVGQYITEGLGIGIADKTKELMAQVKSQASKVKSAYADAFGGGFASGIGARFAVSSAGDSTGAPVTTNVEQTINFYTPVKTPVGVARELKKQAMFGLESDA